MASTLGLCRQVFCRFDAVDTHSVNFFKQQNVLENGDIQSYFSECGKVD